MSFLSPIFFWAAVLIIPLAAIYFLKVKPRIDKTTALFLWKKIYHEKRSSSLFNRLRDLLSLLLMVLVFVLLTLAMTGPTVVSEGQEDLLILIDNSASMAAGGATTRLDKAKKQAADIIAALGPGRRAAVASVAGQVEYHSYLSDNLRQLKRAIDSVVQTDLPFEVGALEKAAASIGAHESSRVILISGGAAFRTNPLDQEAGVADISDDVETKPLLPAEIELIKIASEEVNVGIVECDLQEIPTENSRMTLYYRLANSGSEDIQADFLLYYLGEDAGDDGAMPWMRADSLADLNIPGKLMKAIPVTIQPGINEAMFFYLADALSGRWVAVLDYSDALSLDNVAYLNVDSPEPIQVNVTTENRYFFEHCVQAFAQSTGLLQLTSGTDTGQRADVLLGESSISTIDSGVNPTDGRKQAAILFNPSGSSEYWTITGGTLMADELIVRPMMPDDPALAYYDVSSVPFFGAKQLSIPADSQCLVETDSHIPLIWRINRPELDIYVVNMNPAEGDFYFSPYFPVMVYRLALGLVGREPLKTASYRPGQTVPLEIADGQMISVIDPLGSSQPVTGLKHFGPLDSTGYYQIEDGESIRYVGCSLLCQNETQLDNPSAVSNVAPIRKGHSISYWLICAALMTLLIESILYHRRKVG